MNNRIRINGIEYKVLYKDNNIKKSLLRDIKGFTYSVLKGDEIKTGLSLDASADIYNRITINK